MNILYRTFRKLPSKDQSHIYLILCYKKNVIVRFLILPWGKYWQFSSCRGFSGRATRRPWRGSCLATAADHSLSRPGADHGRFIPAGDHQSSTIWSAELDYQPTSRTPVSSNQHYPPPPLLHRSSTTLPSVIICRTAVASHILLLTYAVNLIMTHCWSGQVLGVKYSCMIDLTDHARVQLCCSL